MKLGFEEGQTPYLSGSQSARAWTEHWAGSWVYCPNCGNSKLDQFEKNCPVADFFCVKCNEEFELKSQKKKFGTKIVDGAFSSMHARLASQNNPNLLLLNYDLSSLAVTNLTVIPKQFFIHEIIEERKPLAPTARRAGWIGCNILLKQIPEAGKVSIVRNGRLQAKELVLAQWRRTLFLREEGIENRGWLIEVMRCTENIGKLEFSLGEIYAFKNKLQKIYPNNRHVRQKIRQQLQVLRDHGYLDFVSRGIYRVRAKG